MKQYYYLCSSLIDLILDSKNKFFSSLDLLQFCEEEMTKRDFNDLKFLYIFNDIKNIINTKEILDDEKKYIYPAYYTLEEFKENLKDPDSFLPFIAEFLFNKKNEKRIYPHLLEIDELITFFYNYLDTIDNQFIRDFFSFELLLRNLTTAISFKKNNLSYATKIIPAGDYYEIILKSNSNDFGLSKEFHFIEKLLEVYESSDLIKREKEEELIRWDYLDEYVGKDFFSTNFVFSYAIKLRSVERWLSLKKEIGEEILTKLIEDIKSKISFSDEIFVVGGKK
ncbi:MAG TPA: DUF2764 family protein [Spirochaetota bacterium]|nr:DUF2764 family protein [Spirochaetota bacterium]HOL56021.1 DUF2764 family protein [Spirochaetota bacterium]HPP03463.1 DUF2764 family protein [Spirochaetota bacterium]